MYIERSINRIDEGSLDLRRDQPPRDNVLWSILYICHHSTSPCTCARFALEAFVSWQRQQQDLLFFLWVYTKTVVIFVGESFYRSTSVLLSMKHLAMDSHWTLLANPQLVSCLLLQVCRLFNLLTSPPCLMLSWTFLPTSYTFCHEVIAASVH